MTERRPPKLGGRFEIESKLGSGAMGVVYRARRLSDGHPVAVKSLKSTADDDLLRRFEVEVASLVALRHPNVVEILDAGVDDDCPWLAMELVHGPSLGERLRATLRTTGQPLPWLEAVRLIQPIAEALAHAHTRSILHRDVKPDNIVVTRDGGRPVLIDFGLIKQAAAEGGLTRTGELVGTPAFMSPEQFSSAGAVGPKTDVWSLACTLFTLIAGRGPFDQPTVVATYTAVTLETPPELAAIRPEAGRPPELDNLIKQCLEKRAKDRPEMAELATQLSELAPAPAAPSRYAPLLAALATALLALLLLVKPAPELLIELPSVPATVREATLIIAGRCTRPGAAIVVEGRRSIADREGRFSLEVELPPGLRRLTLRADEGEDSVEVVLRVRRDVTAPRPILENDTVELGEDEPAVIVGETLHGALKETGRATLMINREPIRLEPSGRFSFQPGEASELVLDAVDEVGNRHRRTWRRIRPEELRRALETPRDDTPEELRLAALRRLQRALGTSWQLEELDTPTLRHEPTNIAFIVVPAGNSQIGSPDFAAEARFCRRYRPDWKLEWSRSEGPARIVAVGAFLLARDELRHETWLRLSGVPALDVGGAAANMSWDAIHGALAELAGELRLPTEHEWERACRAGSTTRFFWGDEPRRVDLQRFHSSKSRREWPSEVRTNAFGLRDMAGGVKEWCADHWRPTHDSPEQAGKRVIRGGCDSTGIISARSANRSFVESSGRSPVVGGRPARSLPARWWHAEPAPP